MTDAIERRETRTGVNADALGKQLMIDFALCSDRTMSPKGSTPCNPNSLSYGVVPQFSRDLTKTGISENSNAIPRQNYMEDMNAIQVTRSDLRATVQPETRPNPQT